MAYVKWNETYALNAITPSLSPPPLHMEIFDHKDNWRCMPKLCQERQNPSFFARNGRHMGAWLLKRNKETRPMHTDPPGDVWSLKKSGPGVIPEEGRWWVKDESLPLTFKWVMKISSVFEEVHLQCSCSSFMSLRCKVVPHTKLVTKCIDPYQWSERNQQLLTNEPVDFEK